MKMDENGITKSKNWNEVVEFYKNARGYGGGQFQVSATFGDRRNVKPALTNEEVLEQGRALTKWLDEQDNPLALHPNQPQKRK